MVNNDSGRGWARRLAWALVVVVAALAASGAAPSAAGAGPGPVARQQRPTGTVSADGLTATDGQRTLRVGQAADLAPGGQSVSVAGSGYDVNKGIYVALCLVTPADQPPSPCGGGIDIDGTSGASAWISSNPPSYGEGLAQPYGAGGTFSVNVAVNPVLAGGFDCRQVQCAIVTRNDHIRTADRSQDLLVPVRFGTGDTSPPPTAPPGSTAPPTTLAPPPPPSTTAPEPAPEVTLSADGRTATVDGRSVTVSAVADLDPAGDSLTVTGAGFDEAKGVLVTLCRVAESPTEAPGPCLAGSTPDASAWVSSNPPDFAADLVVPYEEGGRFEVEIDVAPAIDDSADCREVECAVVVRRDDTDAADRTLDMAVPVAFGEAREEPAATTTTEAEAVATPISAPAVDEGDGGTGSALPWILAALVVVVAGGVASAVVLKRRRAGATGDDGATPTDPSAPPTPDPGGAPS